MESNPPIGGINGLSEEPFPDSVSRQVGDTRGERILSKGAFAELIGVSPARVSQYISAGIIDQSALVGEGRYARVRVVVAASQVAGRRHIGQALGNGIMNRAAQIAVEGHAAESEAPPAAAITASNRQVGDLLGTVGEQILIERLEQEHRRNKREAEAEAKLLAGLVPADAAQRAIRHAEKQTIALFIGMGPAIADALCAKFGLHRDQVMPMVREMLTKAAGKAGRMPPR